MSISLSPLTIHNDVYLNPGSCTDVACLEARMRPWMYADAGFLGQDEHLMDVLQRDREYLRSVGIDYSQIADRLDWVLYKIKGAISKDTRAYALRVQSFFIEWMGCGYQQCPFHMGSACIRENECHCGGQDIKITNELTGKIFRFADLLARLIRYHGFFEGNCIYRVEPKTIIEFFDIKPDDTFQVMPIDLHGWDNVGCPVDLPEDERGQLPLAKIGTATQAIQNNCLYLYVYVTETITSDTPFSLEGDGQIRKWMSNKKVTFMRVTRLGIALDESDRYIPYITGMPLCESIKKAHDFFAKNKRPH